MRKELFKLLVCLSSSKKDNLQRREKTISRRHDESDVPLSRVFTYVDLEGAIYSNVVPTIHFFISLLCTSEFSRNGERTEI